MPLRDATAAVDGNEPVNLVHGDAESLEAGMCFSDELSLTIPGAFGARLEHCFHMTEAGPSWFSVPARVWSAWYEGVGFRPEGDIPYAVLIPDCGRLRSVRTS